MRNWRVLVAVAAVVLAGAAAYLSYEYANKADTRAEKGLKTVDVLVANGDISKGTSASQALDSGLIKTKAVASGVVPPSVVQDGTTLTNKVAVASIAKGQFIVGDSFVEPAAVGGFSSSVPKGKQAITITVDSTHGVAGFVQPGDSVNVLYSGPLGAQQGSAKTGSDKVSAFMIPGAKVMAVGTTTATSAPAQDSSVGLTTSDQAAGASTNTSTATPTNAGLITLEVTPRQAEQISQGSSLGAFYLTLNAPGFDPSKFQAPSEIVNTWNLFDQHLSVVDQARG